MNKTINLDYNAVILLLFPNLLLSLHILVFFFFMLCNLIDCIPSRTCILYFIVCFILFYSGPTERHHQSGEDGNSD